VDPGDLSLLFTLWYARAGKGINYLIGTEGGAQQDRLAGGAQQVSQRLAEALGHSLRLSSPVRRISQENGGVEVAGDGFAVRAKRTIVTVPPALAGRIEYRPAMPASRDQLTQRAPMGSVIKVNAVYDEPFWRDDGLSGRAVGDLRPIKFTFDNSPRGGKPGVLIGFIEGRDARHYSAAGEEERRSAVLRCLEAYFGPRAARPARIVERDWSAEEYSRGCYGAVFPPGTIVSYGKALRQPVGRIHWAGSETATLFPGYMDGAVRSGERAAAEVASLLG
jgi:monoamine oxidase